LKFKCDIELLHIGTEIFGGAEAIDKAVESLREKLGNEVLVTSKIIPLSFFKTRKSIANTTINSVGARIVILPDIGDAVSDNLIHQLVLSASVPVCVLR
jgi:hypothetical protein